MIGLIARYTNWLHTQWPAGKPEKLPSINEDGSTNVPGLWVVGDLTGVPLLKFSLDTGAKTVQRIKKRAYTKPDGGHDLVIIGGGVAGVAAAAEAQEQGLDFVLLEANELFSTIVNFPKKKPIYTYPHDMDPESDLHVDADVKEGLLDELRQQAEERGIEGTPGKATHVEHGKQGMTVHLEDGEPLSAGAVIVAIGRSGNFRRMEVPGEDLDKVANRLHDPEDYAGKKTLIVGGGDSACEAAIAIAECNDPDGEALVTLAYRKGELTRPKQENIQRVHQLAEDGCLNLKFGAEPKEIRDDAVVLSRKGGDDETISNDEVLALIGREPPLDFFRKSGVKIRHEYSAGFITFLVAFFAFSTLIYGMKTGIPPMAWLNYTWADPTVWVQAISGAAGDPTTLLGTLVNSATGHVSFWVTFLYSSAVVAFGIDRVIRRKTPYVKLQTTVLASIQVLPLFIIPEILLPWMGANDWVPQILRENLFPNDEWWRAYGFVLAWPLMVWNIFTSEPLMWWLVIGFVQTFVLIPLLIWRWGKGSYCGWICSCGALAETMGDRHREKMPHGLIWNRMNMVGQVLLWIAIAMLILYIIKWTTGYGSSLVGFLSGSFWKPVVDFFLAGALGVGLYFAYSGRVWCRFACPLAALMHIFTRFSKFRITVQQKKCISCNACTSVCHQGIDIMNFANKGEHMKDPECVRCSACVQACPTGVLQFGTVDGSERITSLDKLVASPTLAREGGDGRLGKDGSGK